MAILQKVNLEILSHYVSVKTPADLRCLDCRKVFYSTIDSFRSTRTCSCKKQKPLPDNPLRISHPILASQWDSVLNEDITPDMVSRGSSLKAWWICKYGHSWQAAVYSRVKGNGCAVCSGSKIVSGTNDFASAEPSLVLEWDFTRNQETYPDQVARYSNTKVWWTCLSDSAHQWKTSPSKRSLGTGCPFCGRVRFKPGVNDLKTLRPDWLIELANPKNKGVQLGNIPLNSKEKLYWSGSCGHEWEQSPHQRGRGFGCTICAGKKVVAGTNDLASEFPDVARYFDLAKNSFDATEVTSHSGKKAIWFCDWGHTYESVIASRVNQKAHCPVCVLKVFQAGVNDITTTHPNLVQQWHKTLNLPLLPEHLTASSRKKVWWQCLRLHPAFLATVRSRKMFGCPYCSGWSVLKGETDLLSKNPQLAKEWNLELNSKTPSEVSTGSDYLAWWTDIKGHTWQQRVEVRSRGVGCPECAQVGFSSVKPGILYLIYHPKLLSRKIGITNVDTKSDRLGLFIHTGWVIEKAWTGGGRTVLNLETLFFRWLRNEIKIPPFLTLADMPRTAGWSETFSAEAVDTRDAVLKIQRLILDIQADVNEFSYS